MPRWIPNYTMLLLVAGSLLNAALGSTLAAGTAGAQPEPPMIQVAGQLASVIAVAGDPRGHDSIGRHCAPDTCAVSAPGALLVQTVSAFRTAIRCLPDAAACGGAYH